MTIQPMIFIYLYNKILYQCDEFQDGNDRRSIISVGRRIAEQDRPRPTALGELMECVALWAIVSALSDRA